MKYFSALILFAFSILQAQTISSVTSGNWSNPLTWGGSFPTPTANIIVGHDVILDIDFGQTSGGSLNILSGASLTGNSNQRGWLSNSSHISNSGVMDVAQLAITGGFVTNDGTLSGINLLMNGTYTNMGTTTGFDSLYCGGVFTNALGANLHANQLWNAPGGDFTNYGSIQAVNFANSAYFVSSGTITTTFDFHNGEYFNCQGGGTVNVYHNFESGDTAAQDARFIIDGQLTVMGDWVNLDSLSGSGNICVYGLSVNAGIMTGAFDFCDSGGGMPNLNTGTIDPGVTFCLRTCFPLSVQQALLADIVVYPNPSSGKFNISWTSVGKGEATIFSLDGKCMYREYFDSGILAVDASNLSPGMYLLQVFADGKMISKRIVVE